MGKRSKASALNHFKDKQNLTWAEHNVGGKVLIVPDSGNAYGDEVSAAQMSEDYVGMRTGDDSAAKAAGETAREQFNIDTEARMMAIRAQQYYSKYASMGMQVVKDNAGKITGAKVLLRYIDPDTEHEEYIEKFVPIELMQAASRG